MTESNVPEVLVNNSEREPDNELVELNKELGKLLENWKFEYGKNQEQKSLVYKKYQMRGSLSAFLDKHKEYDLSVVVGMTDENFDELDAYTDKTEKGDDFVIIVPDFEIGKDNDENFAVKGDTDLSLLPDSILAMNFVKKEDSGKTQ